MKDKFENLVSENNAYIFHFINIKALKPGSYAALVTTPELMFAKLSIKMSWYSL